MSGSRARTAVVCAGPGVGSGRASRCSTASSSFRDTSSCSAIPTPAGTSATAKPFSPPSNCRAPIPIPSPRAGEPWFAWEWGSDVVVGAIHRAAGLPAWRCSTAVVIAAGVWMWFRLHWAMRRQFPARVRDGAAAALHLQHPLAGAAARDQLAVSAGGRVVGGERALPPGASYGAAGAGVLLWANVHASFFLAAVIAAIYAVQRSGTAGCAIAASRLIAPLANPYGWRLYQHVFRYLTDSDLLGRIGEFQSFDFHAAGAGQIIATVILGIAGGTLALTQRRLRPFSARRC